MNKIRALLEKLFGVSPYPGDSAEFVENGFRYYWRCVPDTDTLIVQEMFMMRGLNSLGYVPYTIPCKYEKVLLGPVEVE